jgi:hypothetical protein
MAARVDGKSVVIMGAGSGVRTAASLLFIRESADVFEPRRSRDDGGCVTR